MRWILNTAALCLAAAPALAHHPLQGAPMVTLGQGVLSGLGHPVLGFDHLLFVVAMGLAARQSAHPRLAPAAYVGAMLAGCALMAAGFGLPMREVMIALSLLVVGALVMAGRRLVTGVVVVLFAAFGLFHGAAFGESIVAQEGGAGARVLLGYLAGLGAVQYAVALMAGGLAGMAGQAALGPRFAGAMVAGAGLFLFLEALEGPALALLAG